MWLYRTTYANSTHSPVAFLSEGSHFHATQTHLWHAFYAKNKDFSENLIKIFAQNSLFSCWQTHRFSFRSVQNASSYHPSRIEIFAFAWFFHVIIFAARVWKFNWNAIFHHARLVLTKHWCQTIKRWSAQTVQHQKFSFVDSARFFKMLHRKHFGLEIWKI